MTVYFTTDPSRARKHGRAYSMAMNKNRQILISDGYTLNILEAETMKCIDELVPSVLPVETEDNDVSIHVSHDTNPLPSEVEAAPKTLNIDKGIFLFRSLITQINENTDDEVFEKITTWIDRHLPPQLYDEINYTTVQNASDLFLE